MDPRPYNYQFRRPRLDNRTYQSYNAYESLYHLGKKQYFNTNNILRDEYSQRINLYSPNLSNPYQRERDQNIATNQPVSNTHRYDQIGVNTDKISRSSSNYSQRSKSSASSTNLNPQPNRASVLSTYGSNSLEKKDSNNKQDINVVFTRNDTSQIFKKQQRPFNIINMYSRDTQPLRKFPKLTLQNRLLQQGI